MCGHTKETCIYVITGLFSVYTKQTFEYTKKLNIQKSRVFWRLQGSFAYIQSSFACVQGSFSERGGNVERWGPGVETQKIVRVEIGRWGRVPFNEPYAPSLSTIYDGA